MQENSPELEQPVGNEGAKEVLEDAVERRAVLFVRPESSRQVGSRLVFPRDVTDALEAAEPAETRRTDGIGLVVEVDREVPASQIEGAKLRTIDREEPIRHCRTCIGFRHDEIGVALDEPLVLRRRQTDETVWAANEIEQKLSVSCTLTRRPPREERRLFEELLSKCHSSTSRSWSELWVLANRLTCLPMPRKASRR